MMIAVMLHVITRKTLGGLETDLDGRVLRNDGTVLPGVYAAGEASGFGGGGMHGYRSLEGTFLGGCVLTGRVAARTIAEATPSPPLAAAASAPGAFRRRGRQPPRRRAPRGSRRMSHDAQLALEAFGLAIVTDEQFLKLAKTT